MEAQQQIRQLLVGEVQEQITAAGIRQLDDLTDRLLFSLVATESERVDASSLYDNAFAA